MAPLPQRKKLNREQRKKMFARKKAREERRAKNAQATKECVDSSTTRTEREEPFAHYEANDEDACNNRLRHLRAQLMSIKKTEAKIRREKKEHEKSREEYKKELEKLEKEREIRRWILETPDEQKPMATWNIVKIRQYLQLDEESDWADLYESRDATLVEEKFNALGNLGYRANKLCPFDFSTAMEEYESFDDYYERLQRTVWWKSFLVDRLKTCIFGVPSQSKYNKSQM